MLVGLSKHVSPPDETVDAKPTVPVNPLMGATVTVEVPVAPSDMLTDVGLVVMEKSGFATL